MNERERKMEAAAKSAAVNQIREAGLPALATYVQGCYALGISIDQVSGWLREAARICQNPGTRKPDKVIQNEPGIE